MAHIRAWADIEARGGDDWLTPAEQQLIKACNAGELCVLGDGTLPPESTPHPDREVRAAVLRYLILGGCKKCPVDAIGVWAQGGHVTGTLNLDFCSAKGALQLFNCRFDHRLDTEQTRFALVNLSGSHLNGWWAQGMVSKGAVFLRDITTTATVALNRASIGGPLACEKTQFKATEGFALNAQGAKVTGGVFLSDITATAAVALNSATIGGQLVCEKAQFKATEGIAFNAQSAQINGDVFLHGTVAKATISLSGAKMGGQLACIGVQLEATDGLALDAQRARIKESVFLRGTTAKATIDLNGAEIDGQLNCVGAQLEASEGYALNAQDAQIKGGLFFRGLKHPARPVNFQNTHAGALADDPACWPEASERSFDGFTYDRIYGPTDAARRIEWLKKGSYWEGDFYPQPFTQLAKVLRDMGHDRAAREVLYERERLIRRHNLQTAVKSGHHDTGFSVKALKADSQNLAQLIGDACLRWLVGYGYYPFRSLVALILLIVLAILPAHSAWEEGSFAPNSGPVLTSEGWLMLHDSEVNPAAVWSGEVAQKGWVPPDASDLTDAIELQRAWEKVAPGRDWETFNRYAYAVDVVIPIIDIGQTAAWAPSTTRGPWGWHLWWLKGVISVAGWIVTALGAAAITGIIRRD